MRFALILAGSVTLGSYNTLYAQMAELCNEQNSQNPTCTTEKLKQYGLEIESLKKEVESLKREQQSRIFDQQLRSSITGKWDEETKQWEACWAYRNTCVMSDTISDPIELYKASQRLVNTGYDYLYSGKLSGSGWDPITHSRVDFTMRISAPPSPRSNSSHKLPIGNKPITAPQSRPVKKPITN